MSNVHGANNNFRTQGGIVLWPPSRGYVTTNGIALTGYTSFLSPVAKLRHANLHEVGTLNGVLECKRVLDRSLRTGCD